MSFWYTCRMPAADKADQEKGLRHQLGAGQMAMIAVGGSIGTGLLLGSAAALEIAGPGVILSFALAALITLTVTMALGELSSVHPGAGSFGLYGDLYLNQWAGFIARAGYWAALSISIGAELVASATYLAFWFPSVPALFWVVIFSAMLLLINLRSVGNYARFEYWFAMIKVAAIVAFIVLGVGLLLSGRVAPQYTTQGGFLPHGSKAPWLAMGFAIYTFAGVEFVAITTFVILTAALSGANAAIYAASRVLFSLARTGWAPAVFGRLNASGSPRLALLASSYGIVVALVLEKWAPKNAFVSILGAALVGMLLSWLVSLAAHVKFRQKLSSSQVAALPMRSPLGAWGSTLGFLLIIVAVLETGWRSHLTLISGAVYVVVLTAAYFLLRKRLP